MFKLLSKPFQWLSSLFAKGYSIKHMNEEPEVLRRKTLYLIGENSFYVYALMLCPCGCNSKIHLNLLPGKRPLWLFESRSGKPTLSPSVWRQIGCKSHFFIRNGEVIWAGSKQSEV
jgi:hypothetical protein